MWGFRASGLPRLWGARYRRRMERALALNLRGEARSDGLRIAAVKTRLEIEWYVREIHPWDRDESDACSSLFVLQTLKDTEAAIYRLFSSLPEIDAIALAVREQCSNDVILSGTVFRSTVPDPHLSVGMRLREWGVTYHSDGFRFEPHRLRAQPPKT
jgi:hypothetical protein